MAQELSAVEAFLRTLPQVAQEVYAAAKQRERKEITSLQYEAVMDNASAELKGDTRPVLAASGLAMGDDVKVAKQWLRDKLWVDNHGRPADFPTCEDKEAVVFQCCFKMQEITLPLRVNLDGNVRDMRQQLKDRLVEVGYCQPEDGPVDLTFGSQRLRDDMTLASLKIRPGCVLIFAVAELGRVPAKFRHPRNMTVC